MMKNYRGYISILSSLLILFLVIHFPVCGQKTQQDLVKREIKILKGQTYLNFPVNNSDPLLRITISLDGKPLDRFTINLAREEPRFWTFFDVTPYQGKKLTVETEEAAQGFQAQNVQNIRNPSEIPVSGTKGFEMIFAGSGFPGQDSLYKEKERPQVHFSAQRGWINDPNGLLYDAGEYHMYFQHNPYGWQWGNMHWGSAVSRDLIHWEELKEALYPVIDEKTTLRGDAAFSGSAVLDPENTAGFRKNGKDPVIAVYTSTGRGECLKISYDDGRTFEDFAGNPVLRHNGRDPKVFWYEPGEHWVMVVWDAGVAKKIGLDQEVSVREHSIYTSPDLKNWTYQSGVPGFFECPELFELPVEGQTGLSKWVMYDASGRYIIGDFDGTTFKTEQGFTKYENGGGYFYASQTFSNTPDGRRIQVGWGRNITQPGMPFNQAELFPCDLKLRWTLSGYRLCPTPVEEIRSLFKDSQVLTGKIIQPGESACVSVDPDKPVHVLAEIERGDAPVGLNILGYELRYDNEWIFTAAAPDEGKVSTEAPAGPFPAPAASAPVIYDAGPDIFKVEAIVDKNILEFFINDGELYYVTAFNGVKSPKVEAFVPGSAGKASSRKFILRKLEVNELNSIWRN